MQRRLPYPKTHRDRLNQLTQVLRRVPALSTRDCEDLAAAINNLADKACDLEDIFQKLTDEEHSSAELADLLVAFELTLEQMRGYSEELNGKLYDCADRLKGSQQAENRQVP